MSLFLKHLRVQLGLVKIKTASSINQNSNLQSIGIITPQPEISGVAHLRGLAPRQHHSEKKSQQRRPVGDTDPNRAVARSL